MLHYTIMKSSNKKDLSLYSLLRIISKQLYIDADLIFLPTRKREVVEARIIYAYFCKELKPNVTLEKIGDSINKDHASIIHYLKKAKIYSEVDKEFNNKIKLIKQHL